MQRHKPAGDLLRLWHLEIEADAVLAVVVEGEEAAAVDAGLEVLVRE